jgi:hypothetical protein
MCAKAKSHFRQGKWTDYSARTLIDHCQLTQQLTLERKLDNHSWERWTQARAQPRIPSISF